MNTETKKRTLVLTYSAFGAAIIAICSMVTVPAAVPFTLQTFAVFLLLFLFGDKRALLSVLTYILMGLVGLPVFSGFKAGPGVLFGLTGGYIVGFVMTAVVYLAITRILGKNTGLRIPAMILGLAVCYAFGTAWFIVVYQKTVGAIGIAGALSMCVFPFIIPDLLKLALAFFISKRLAPLV